MSSVHEFTDLAVEPPVRGFLHQPAQPSGNALVLTHGAGANCNSRLLTALAGAFADAGFLVLRCDLPFRQVRPFGPPFPAMAARDRQGLRRAEEILRQKASGRIFLGGHSYGGRQATMLAAEQPDLVAGLLLLSYPLHPPRKPAALRTAHFPQLKTPALFVHGGRDPFGSHEEMQRGSFRCSRNSSANPNSHKRSRLDYVEEFQSSLASQHECVADLPD
jgi:predicted alpha/beta-hydrolase family hydrolase